MLDHIGRCVRVAVLQQRRYAPHVIAAREQRKLVAVVPPLREPDVRRQSIAQTPASHRIRDVAALRDVRLEWLRRTSISELTSCGAIRGSQVAKVAHPLTLIILLRDAVNLDELEWVPGGRRARVGADAYGACGDTGKHTALELRRQPRLDTEGEQRSHLHSRCAGGARSAHRRRRTSAPREPERQSQLTHLRQIDHVALAVNRLTAIGEAGLSSWRGVVTARGRTFHHEAVHPPGGLPRQRRGE